MKKIGVIIFLLTLAVTTYGQQNDTTYITSEKLQVALSELETEINNLKKRLSSEQNQNEYFEESLKRKQHQIDSLNQKFLTVNSKTDSLIGILSGFKSSIRKSFANQETQLDQLNKRIDSLSNRTITRIAETTKEIDSAKSQLAGLENQTETKFSAVTSTLSESIWWVSSGILFVLLISFVGFWQLRGKFSKGQKDLDNRLTQKSKQLENKLSELEQTNKADTKLLEILNAKLEEMPSQGNLQEVDHSIALASALEIIRMRKRIERMDADAKGLKSLSKALERLEDELEIKGYEIIDLEGQAYHDGMNVKANFVPDENLGEDESVITRTIKPQVNFKGKAIQHAQVQVATGTKNNS